MTGMLMMNWSNDPGLLLCFCLLALAAGVCADRVLERLYPGKTYYTAAASMLAAAVLFCVHGPSIVTLQYWLICQILLYASAHDRTAQMVPDYVHVLLLAVGLLHIPSPLASVAGLLLVPLPFLLVALIVPEKLGGADIKLMAALGFTLGVRAGVGAAIIGLLMAVVFQAAQKNRAGFALIPYLSFGAFLAFLT